MWRIYQELVDQILESALSAVGGSISKLEKALDRLASTPAKGSTRTIIGSQLPI